MFDVCLQSIWTTARSPKQTYLWTCWTELCLKQHSQNHFKLSKLDNNDCTFYEDWMKHDFTMSLNSNARLKTWRVGVWTRLNYGRWKLRLFTVQWLTAFDPLTMLTILTCLFFLACFSGCLLPTWAQIKNITPLQFSRQLCPMMPRPRRSFNSFVTSCYFLMLTAKNPPK